MLRRVALYVATLDDGPTARQTGRAPTTIVGGAGFIGRRLTAELLTKGYVVRIVDVVAPIAPLRPEVEYREADVRDFDGLAQAIEGSRVVYNLAAIHRDDVRPASLYYEVNVGGASNVTRACRIMRINKLIFSSSVAVYGTGGTDISEEQPPTPSNEYGRSKLLAEQEHRDWQSEAPQDRTLVIVRPSVVFGEHNRGNVYRLLKQIVDRRFVMVGNGETRKSMAYVDNLSSFLVHVNTLGPGVHLYNYADKPDLSMNELVAIALHELGRPSTMLRVPYIVGLLGGLACDFLAYTTRRNLPVSATRVRKFCTTTTFVAQRARTTGFAPPIRLHDALRRTIKREISDEARRTSDSRRPNKTS